MKGRWQTLVGRWQEQQAAGTKQLGFSGEWIIDSSVIDFFEF